MRVSFDRRTGQILEIENKTAGETYAFSGGGFMVEGNEFRIDSADTVLESLEAGEGFVRAVYRAGGRTVEVTCTLKAQNHFVEKRLAVVSDGDYGLREVVLVRGRVCCASGAELRVVPYRYQKNVTYFGRTARGGFFTGVEMPFDASHAEGNRITLGYLPNIKVKAEERLECEPVYFGVYRKGPDEGDALVEVGEGTHHELPLQSESDAMVAMTSALLGPPRHGLAPIALAGHSEMEHFDRKTAEQMERDKKSLEVLAECGIDWLLDNAPWAGATKTMDSLNRFEIGGWSRELLSYARKLGFTRILLFGTMNNAEPWYYLNTRPGVVVVIKNPDAEIHTGPFRPDKPEWVMSGPRLATAAPGGGRTLWREPEGNCIACEPFRRWLTRMYEEALDTDSYSGISLDGDFFGGGGFVTSVTCRSGVHDHFAGDATYACLRAQARILQDIRERHPGTYIWLMRPSMDQGVWSIRNADTVFPINEFAQAFRMPRMREPHPNVMSGDKIRTWSRVRVHQHFFPHYLDLAQLGYFVMPEWGESWHSERFDYAMLSALSCTPNHTYYIPTRSGMPEEDKAEIRKWLDWGRKNIEYLLVRRDLPNWPGAGVVDGSAHITDDRGIIFLFNPNPGPLRAELPLTAESIGLRSRGRFNISQEYPSSDRSAEFAYGETAAWEVQGETAAVLRIKPGPGE